MYSRLSRYRAVPVVVAPDPRGRVLAATDFRPLPEVTGTLQHTVEAGDRLDQLAASYYGQPVQYWHICDANPAFLSPLALLGQETLVVNRFPVSFAGTPPLAALLDKLMGTVGVVAAAVSEDVTLRAETQPVNGKPTRVVVEHLSRAVTVTHNRANLDVRDVRAAIESVGFAAGPPAEGGQLGAEIVIPPAVVG